MLVVTRLDRLAQSLTELSRITVELGSKGIGLRCSHQGAVDTTNPEGRLMLQLLGSFAAFETAISKDRQVEGLEKAKAAGRCRGRPKTIDAEEVRRLLATGMGPTAVTKTMGVGRASICRVSKESA